LTDNAKAELLAPTQRDARLIAAHFRFEEQGGYMRDVRKRQPRLERERAVMTPFKHGHYAFSKTHCVA
jgi:hypothetical protein